MRSAFHITFMASFLLVGCIGGPQPEPPAGPIDGGKWYVDAGAGLDASASDAGGPSSDAAVVRDAGGPGPDASPDGAVIDGAVIDGAVIDGAVIDGAVIDGAVIDGAVIDGAVIDGAVIDGSVTDGGS